MQLSFSNSELTGQITLSGSKSESNRWLILQKQFPQIEKIINLSNSQDTQLLQQALESIDFNFTELQKLNIHHAGTAMRFLTAFLAAQPNIHVQLYGSERMHQRPIEPLVKALNELGADVQYIENEGFPPLEIKGKEIEKNSVKMLANISSQFITALLLAASNWKKGLNLELEGNITSKPYLEMTLQQLNQLGIQAELIDNTIQIKKSKKIESQVVTVESDWSSASYWYSLVAISDKANIGLKFFKNNSLQGDSVVSKIYESFFGVKTYFQDEDLLLTNLPGYIKPHYINLNLISCPDIAQTIAVTAAALKIKIKLLGLHTLLIKETNRLQALKNELEKIGAEVKISEDSLEIVSYDKKVHEKSFATYQDHRMAMSFAPLALLYPINIENAEVVEKSYPNFWKDLTQVGFQIQE